MKKPVLAITMGDPAGIGPEVTVKALQYRDLWDKCIPIVVGDAYVLEDALRFSGFNRTIRSIGKPEEAVGEPGTIECVDLHALAPEKYQYGQVSAACGEAAFQYVVKAIEYAQAGRVAGVVTAPINKEALHLAGHYYSGHTEIFADYTHTPHYAMLARLWTFRKPLRSPADGRQNAYEPIRGHGTFLELSSCTVPAYWICTTLLLAPFVRRSYRFL